MAIGILEKCVHFYVRICYREMCVLRSVITSSLTENTVRVLYKNQSFNTTWWRSEARSTFLKLKLNGKCKQNLWTKFGIIYCVAGGTFINRFSWNSKDRCWMNPKSYSGQRCKISARPPARVTEPRCRRCYSQGCSSAASGRIHYIVFKQFIIPIVRATSYNVSQRIMELDGHFYEERNFILRF